MQATTGSHLHQHPQDLVGGRGIGLPPTFFELSMDHYKHVTDAITRGVLNGDVSEDAIRHALTFTRGCFIDDLNNPNLPAGVIARRQIACEAANAFWTIEGNAANCIKALQEFWSV